MKASQACYDFVKKQEGLSLHAYRDGAGVPTIGWGTIRYDDEKPVKMGDVCTVEEAQHYLEREVGQVEAAINETIKVPLTQAEADALTSFAYNVGTGWITGKNHKQATLVKLLNGGNYNAVPGQLLLFERDIHGVIEPGLQKRRKWESMMWLAGEQDHSRIVAAAPQNPPGLMPQVVTPSPDPAAASKPEAVITHVSTTGGSIIMNKLLFKMGAQWALQKLGEGTTYAGFWAWYHINVDAMLNRNLEASITNVFLAIAGAALIAVNEGWHKQAA